jgi:hypothetical protein
MFDEDLHHLQMALTSGGHERGPSLLSETDTHTVRETPRHATKHYPHTDNYLYTNTHTLTYIHIVCIFKDSCASICYCIHTYIHTVWASTQTAHPYVTAYIHTYNMGIHTDCAYRDTSLSHTSDYLHIDIH